MIEQIRKLFAEWLCEKALLIYPEGKERDSLERCLYAHSCFVIDFLKKNNKKIQTFVSKRKTTT